MKLIAAQRRSVIWVDGNKQDEYALPPAIVQRIAELERLAARDALPKSPKAVARLLADLRARQAFCDSLKGEADAELAETMIAVLEQARPTAEVIVLGSWVCEQSPTGECAYDDAEDPCHDDCLFCGQPSERK